MEQDQKSRIGPRNFFTNHRGQAVVEYILLLVVIVSLILGAKRAFSNVNTFMSNYIGDYVACLMEYGELPSLGVAEADLKKHEDTGKICQTNFGDFTFAGGVPYTGGGTGPGGGPTAGPGGRTRSGSTGAGRSNMANSRNSSQNADRQSSSRRGSESNTLRDAASGSSAGGGGGRGSSPYSRGTLRRSSAGYGAGDGVSAAGSEKVSVIEDPNAGDKERRRGRSGRYRGNRYVYNNNRYKAVTGRMAEEIEKKQPKKPPLKKTSVTKIDEGSGIGPTKKAFTPPTAKREVASTNEDSGFKFGNILRWLLIAGMVIAIVIFFGGQLLNYSNSQD